jgi:beta-N-acetylhexosaminidase
MQSLAEQIGQLLIVGVDSPTVDADTAAFLRDIQPGGFIFFQRNIVEAESFRDLVANSSKILRTAPFLSIDLEGGLVDRFRNVLAPLPAVRDVASAGMGRELGRMAGREVAVFGLNVDFAPVLDLGSPESESVLGSRTAGPSPDEVIRFAREFLAGLSSEGIVGCGKHFPGLGSGQSDSHKEMPTVDKSEARMWDEDLKPYRMMAAELPMIMVAHAYCPGLEAPYDEGSQNSGRVPASLSHRIVTGLLKKRLGYDGLVLCDDLEMGGVLEGRSMEEAGIGALAAGCEILLLCGATANTRRVYDALLKEASNSPSLRAIVETAAGKIAQSKEKLGIGKPDGNTALPTFADIRREISQFQDDIRAKLA